MNYWKSDHIFSSVVDLRKILPLSHVLNIQLIVPLFITITESRCKEDLALAKRARELKVVIANWCGIGA